jgi:hypothetical protein
MKVSTPIVNILLTLLSLICATFLLFSPNSANAKSLAVCILFFLIGYWFHASGFQKNSLVPITTSNMRLTDDMVDPPQPQPSTQSLEMSMLISDQNTSYNLHSVRSHTVKPKLTLVPRSRNPKPIEIGTASKNSPDSI